MQSIRYIENKFKSFLEDDRYFFLPLLLVTTLAAFGLGRLSITGVPVVLDTDQSESRVEMIATGAASDDRLTIPPTAVTTDTVVGSRNGTRYYPLDCSGVDRISEENRIYFPGVDQALAAGYTPSVQC